jgi:fructose-1,6-bisphosphatase II
MGIGGVTEGVIAACGVKALGGGMLGKLAPQSHEEAKIIQEGGFDPGQIMTCTDMVSSNDIYFAVTGITDSPLLPAIHYHGRFVETNSLLLRAATGTRRFIQAEHLLDKLPSE